MSTRPRKPAPATPAPGKLPLTELAEMKQRRQRIVMVTAYDAPSGRLADEAGMDIVLVGDSAAMTVLGHASTVPGHDGRDDRARPGGDARRAAAARRRGHAVRLLPGLGRDGRGERRALRQGSRRGRREDRGRGADAVAGTGARRFRAFP